MILILCGSALEKTIFFTEHRIKKELKKTHNSKFIEESLSDLLEGINNSYGPILMDELNSRIKRTIEEFNAEMVAAFDELKNKENNRQKMYSMIKEGSIPSKKSEVEPDNSIWQKKIEEIESQK